MFFLRSPDLLACADPRDATWETLPEGDVGLQDRVGRLKLGEEPHVLEVCEGGRRLFCCWRTDAGRVASAYSDDGGASWDTRSSHAPAAWMSYDAAGRHPLRNPRGAITPYRFLRDAPGGRHRFAFLFYNNGRLEREGYVGREVVWITVGTTTTRGGDGARGACIEWAQPEIVLWWGGEALADREGWNPDTALVDGFGYCDFVELPSSSEEGENELFFVGSNKLSCRCFRVAPRTLALLDRQRTLRAVPRDGLVAAFTGLAGAAVQRRRMPVLPDLRAGGGFTLLLWIRARHRPGAHASGRGIGDRFRGDATVVGGTQRVTAALDESATTATIVKGFTVATTGLTAGPGRVGGLTLRVSNGFGAEFAISTDDVTTCALADGAPHLVGFVVDGGPKVASVVVDGRLCDGGSVAPQGWQFVPRGLGEIGGAQVGLHTQFGAPLPSAGDIDANEGHAGELLSFLCFHRALLTSEVIGAWRAGPGATEEVCGQERVSRL